ncbi:glycosyltransferase [Occallatibacter savannae]|uniref:glycosyltransferase n=1 Tax=Occallatibacter savannae TaxID=1002691 RepID=UPI000D68BFC3|nr:glycosyltransferase [Occallatibacter savannae]
MRIGLQAWGSEGDISPFLVLAAGLVREGHEVTLAVTDNAGRDYSRHAHEGKYELVSIPLPPPTNGEDVETIWRKIIEIGNPLRQAELVLKFGYDPVADEMLEAATALAEKNDALIGHFFAYPLQIAAERASKPAATLQVVHNCVPTNAWQAPGVPNLGTWSHRPGWRLAQSIVNRIFLPRYNRQRMRLGLAPLRDTMTQAWASSRLNLIAVSPSICNRPHDWASNHVVTGFINEPSQASNRPLPASLQAFLDQGEPPVFIGFGSMMHSGAADYARETIEIWRDVVSTLKTRAVFQLPEPLLSLVRTESSVHAVSWADYRLLFPRCSAIVHHGGAGTTQSALRAGRPSVIVAHVSDQFFWGQELERLGVAGPTQRRKGLSAAKLSQAIRVTLNDPLLAPDAKSLGESMLKEDGLGTAIRAVGTALQRTGELD